MVNSEGTRKWKRSLEVKLQTRVTSFYFSVNIISGAFCTWLHILNHTDDPLNVDWTFFKVLGPVGWHFPEATSWEEEEKKQWEEQARARTAFQRGDCPISVLHLLEAPEDPHPLGCLPCVGSPTLYQHCCVDSTAAQKRWRGTSERGWEGNHGFCIVLSLAWLLFGSQWLPALGETAWWGAELSLYSSVWELRTGPLVQVSWKIAALDDSLTNLRKQN